MSPPYTLPPLNALRAFEAAGRHLSFARAADELNVTPAAVSQQIKNLEIYLQIELFRRQNRTITLSKEAQLLLPGLRDGFEKMNESVKSFLRYAEQSSRRHANRGSITISTPPSFASRWLVPRLDNWKDDHPGTDIRISASLHLVDFEKEGIDLSIHFGSGSYNGLQSEPLSSETMVVVCSPIFVDGANPLSTPSDLKNHTLLHVKAPHDEFGTDWRHWLKAADVDDVDFGRGLFFADATVAILSAIGGQGILLTNQALVEEDIEKGHLAMPFEINLSLKFSWYVVGPTPNLLRPDISAFKDWLIREAVG